MKESKMSKIQEELNKIDSKIKKLEEKKIYY